MRILLSLLLLTTFARVAEAQLAIRGEQVYTMAGDPITDGVVLVRDGVIEQVGAASDITIPNGYRTLTAAVVMPGLIDAHSVVGLAGQYNYAHDQDQLETSNPIQPELRALDAYNAREPLVEWVRNLGVTTVHTGHGPGALISGQTMVVKTSGETLAEALVESVTMVAMTLGPRVSSNFKSPGTRAKGVAMLRSKLVEAQAYREKWQDDDEDNDPTRNLQLEILTQVLDGDIPALVTAHKVTEIMAALRLKEEFGLNLVLDGASEAYLVLDAIKAADVPVLIHPPMMRAGGETASAAMDTAVKLHEAGIPFAFQSGFEAYVPKTRVVHFEAAIAAAHGLPRNVALAAITRTPAEILGLSDRIGTLEAGKDADLVLFDGDPLEYTTHTCGVVINGVVISETCR